MKNISSLGIAYSLAILSVFYSPDTFIDASILPKHFFLMFSGIISLGIIMLHYWKKQRLTYNVTAVDSSVFIYVAYVTAHMLFSGARPLDHHYYLSLLVITVLYFVYRPVFESNDRFKNTVLWIIIIIGALQALYGFSQYLELFEKAKGEFKITGTYGNPGPFTNMLVAILPFCIAGALAFQKKADKNIAWLATVAIILVLPFSQSRTSWIAALAAMGYSALHLPFALRIIEKIRASLLNKILVLVVLVAVVVSAYFALTSFKQDSATGRVFVWKVSLEMIKDKPLLGHGYLSYPVVHNNYQAEYFNANPNDWDNAYVADCVVYAFNEFIEIVAETGLVGLLMFLLIIYFTFRKKRLSPVHDTNFIRIGAEGSIIAILCCALFSYPFKNTPVLLLLFFCLAVISGDTSKTVLPIHTSAILRKVLIVIGLVLCLFTWRLTSTRFTAEKEWLQTFHLARQNKQEIAKANYERLLPHMRFDQFFVYNYAAELMAMGHYSKSLELLQSIETRLNDVDYNIYMGANYVGLGEYKTALSYYKKAADMVPTRFYPKYSMVMVYLSMNDTANAKEMARHIVNMPIKIETDISQNIRAEMYDILEKY